MTATGAIPRATHEGVLELGSIKIACAVLDDRRRIVDARDLARMFGSREGDELSAVRALATGDLAAKLDAPVAYRPMRGPLAYGYEATLLPMICLEIISGGSGRDSQRGIVDAATRILDAMFTAGRQALGAEP